MQITVDVSKILRTVPRDLSFVLNALSESSIHSAGIPEFLDSGRKSWTLDSGTWTLDAGANGAISRTSLLNSTLKKIFGHFRYENLSTVYSFQANLSIHLKISKTRGFQMMWRGTVDLR